MTIGDVMATVAAVGVTGVTLWAAQVSCAFLYEQKTEKAAELLTRETWKTLWTGLGLTVAAGGVTFILLAQPNGLIKLIGWVMLAALLAHSVLGAAGLAVLGGERVKRMAPRLSRLAAISRAAGMLITAGFLPVFGWLFIFPVAFCFSLGAGWRAMTYRSRLQPAPAPESAPAPPLTAGR